MSKTEENNKNLDENVNDLKVILNNEQVVDSEQDNEQVVDSEQNNEQVVDSKQDNEQVVDSEQNNEQVVDSEQNNDPKDSTDAKELDLDSLIKERDDLKDKLMRSLAESENIRKRALKDRQDAEIYAVSKMSRDILSVYDNLQRALDLAEDILDEKYLPLVEGLELTKKDLLDTLKKNKIEKVEPLTGDKFDPKLHQAMMEAPSNEVEKGCIIQVLSVGFLIGERLLRASNVTVSSGQTGENKN